ncbi:hypothetical protein Desti_4563 [Desulfomonile tiedjei DSM 6799]|uniref:Uncharacterized protein n=1 Tax=Desulfomonile tiedjei (strain ATCC 49306 / DSM 6799 / DCB-1) TaxID=706587 RepID=I4CC99_DESTA|nr:hypothetical protein Desti_4563 [Desulfomonile tiedjei DSM 6799]
MLPYFIGIEKIFLVNQQKVSRLSGIPTTYFILVRVPRMLQVSRGDAGKVVFSIRFNYYGSNFQIRALMD